MSSTPMKAWVYTAKGAPSTLVLKSDWPKPTPGSKQVLVRVKAAALNQGWRFHGVFPMNGSAKIPAVAECDYSGIVEGGDLSGTGLSVGDEVFGSLDIFAPAKTGMGSLAQWCLVNTEVDAISKKPSHLSWEEAAGWTVSGVSALSGLDVAGVPEGGRVFINGGSSGLGAALVQIAKAKGFYVVTTCSPRSYSMVEKLGADEVVDYQAAGNLPKHLGEQYGAQPFDAIVDAIGVNGLYSGCSKFLKKTGKFVDMAVGDLTSTRGMLSTGLKVLSRKRPSFLGGGFRTYEIHFTPVEAMPKFLPVGVSMLEKKQINPVPIDSVYAFKDVKAAFEKLLSGRAMGKIIVTMD